MLTLSQQNLSSCPPKQKSEGHLLSLDTLPSELIQLIVANLATPALKSAALTCHALNRHATDVLWQNVCLVDRQKIHTNHRTEPSTPEPGQAHLCDDHDDTPIVQKLYILATNPVIASKVQLLTHRCHLPSPNIFTELPRMYFDGENLSQNSRLHLLLALAVRNLVNVHTLRIIYGHMKLTSSLIVGLLHQNRPRRVPLRRLWLESCCLSVTTIHFLMPSRVTGLESVRIRRLELASPKSTQSRERARMEFRLSRGGQFYHVHNGSGGWVGTTVQFSEEGLPAHWPRPSTLEVFARGEVYDTAMWDNLSTIKNYVDSHDFGEEHDFVPTSPREPIQWLLECSAPTLTSLNLDWILWRRSEDHPYDNAMNTLCILRKLRFPHLYAFQVRNAVLPLTKLPDDVFLLEDTFLEFLEAHPKIRCLAWPLDRFYGHVKSSVSVQNRTRKLVAHLAMTLTDLRIDTQYAGHGEPLTDEGRTPEEQQSRLHRIRFIFEFLPYMRKVEQIKLEGGIPRDEKREILKALHWCPLKKIVMIGVSFPAGNTWGAQGLQLKALDPGQGSDYVYNLEEEDLAGILEWYRRGSSISPDFTFEPSFGWPSVQAPLLKTIALHHASTVEELKICGYNGCPILSSQTPITNPLLIPLRYYANLKQLVISLWLLTWYEDSYRDAEIIQSWLDTRSPSSTALVVVTPPTSPLRDHPVDPGHFPSFNATSFAQRQQFNRWAVALRTRFSPSALAYRVARDIGPYLNPVAKERPGGVRVRASFCLGIKEQRRSANDIFDLDICIGRDNQVLEFVGPREEGEKGRWWTKLEARRWF